MLVILFILEHILSSVYNDQITKFVCAGGTKW